VSAIVGTGLGGGVVTAGRVVTGRNGFGGELGHVFLQDVFDHRFLGTVLSRKPKAHTVTNVRHI
jgi:hypothetical protein